MEEALSEVTFKQRYEGGRESRPQGSLGKDIPGEETEIAKALRGGFAAGLRDSKKAIVAGEEAVGTGRSGQDQG